MNPIPEPLKILVRSPNWVGDAVMATPVPTALKKSYPDCEIHVLARSWVAAVWENHPAIDKIIPMNKKQEKNLFHWLGLVKVLQKEHYDIGLCLPNSFSSAWLQFWAGCEQKIGYFTQSRHFLLHAGRAWKKSYANQARPITYLKLTQCAGVDMDHAREMNFNVSVSKEQLAGAATLIGKEKDQSIVGLAPGSVATSRRWPADRYAALADRLAQAGYKVVLVGSPGDKEIAQKVVRKCKSKPMITAGETDLKTGLTIIKCLNLLISNDSGAMHMAYAQQIPVLVLQGAANPDVTGPFGKSSRYLREDTLDCAPCVKNECPKKNLVCMKKLSVERVWETVQEMLSKKSK